MRVSRGASLLELMVACAAGTVVLGAGIRTLYAVRRFWFAERAALEAHAAARAATLILAAELRGTSPRSGDLLRVSDTALTIRAPRALLAACAPAAAGVLAVARDLAGAPRTPVAGRESVLVFLASDAGDRWLHFALGSVNGGSCPGGGAWRLGLAGTPAARAALDSVAPGAPVRTFETANYRLYDDGTHTWWLGVRTWQGGAWSSTSPLAGPLRARDGLALRYLGADGAAAPNDTLVRLIGVTVRAEGAAPAWAPGRSGAVRADSATVLVAPRN